MSGAVQALTWLEKPHEGGSLTYTDPRGRTHALPCRYPQVHARPLLENHEEFPGIFHTAFALEGFHFCDRIDLHAIRDDEGRVLLVDTGHYDLSGLDYLESVRAAMGTHWEDTEVFLTHLHDDHAGNVSYCLAMGARRVYRGACRPYAPSMAADFLRDTGTTRAGEQATETFLGFLMGEGNPLFGPFPELQEVGNGDAIDIAGYHWEVLETPGHTAEHLCLWEPEHGFLFAGDHLVVGAPGVMQLASGQHLLASFLNSLRHLQGLDLRHVFMSHHEPLDNPDDIQRLIAHILATYDRPLEKTARVLEEGPLSAYEATEAYCRHLDGGLAGLPRGMRIRRVATTLGYLDYLVDTGRARASQDDDGVLIYEKAPSATTR